MRDRRDGADGPAAGARGVLAALAAAALLGGMTLGAGCPPENISPPDDDTEGDDDFSPNDDDDDDDFTPADDDDDDTGLDEDGDGWLAGDGDCDDTDPDIHPGVDDVCDAHDNDCDGRLNEDSPGWDEYEPNDDEAYDLGDFSGAVNTVNSFFHAPGDQDRFLFYVEDGFIDWFQIDIEAITVPDDVDLSLELLLVDDADHQYVGTLDTADAGDLGDGEAIYWDGDGWSDDSGTYELRVTAEAGFDCSLPYSVVIDNS